MVGIIHTVVFNTDVCGVRVNRKSWHCHYVYVYTDYSGLFYFRKSHQLLTPVVGCGLGAPLCGVLYLYIHSGLGISNKYYCSAWSAHTQLCV